MTETSSEEFSVVRDLSKFKGYWSSCKPETARLRIKLVFSVLTIIMSTGSEINQRLEKPFPE